MKVKLGLDGGKYECFEHEKSHSCELRQNVSVLRAEIVTSSL